MQPSTQQKLLEIVSGKRNGIVPLFVRGVLSCLTPFYRLAITRRNKKFDSGQDVNRVDVPVISIGNITTGGTGKTPMVIYVAKLLRSMGLRVAIVSRGYGRDEGSQATRSVNDEALELEHRLPDVPHLQDPDRSRIAAIAIEELESQVILMDDGFQHRRLHRDLDIVLIDALVPFGYGRLLPRGLLREPLSSFARADVIVVTRCDAVDDSALSLLKTKLKSHNSGAVIAAARTVHGGWIQFDNERSIAGPEAGSKVFAFCAIGNPAGFRHSLEQTGVEVCGFREFPDHHNFSRDELEQVTADAKSSGAESIVCTHKDLVKVCVNRLGGLAVHAMLIETVLDAEQSEFESKIRVAAACRGSL
ncbi:MAG: tetraacyldisaccharide 4'-kinase [Planctomycetota bacterium]